jgi:hypothetical protein
MNFVNLTPHALTLRATDGTDTIVPPSGAVARVGTVPGAAMGEAGGIALFSRTEFGAVEGLPEPEAGTIFIVSGLVAGRVFGRDDVFSPGTGPKDGAIRNEAGHIIAVTRLVQAG